MDEQVLRREFLKHGCSLGLCACAGSALMAQAGEGAQEEKKQEDKKEDTASLQDTIRQLQGWLGLAQKQTATLWQLLETHLDEKTRVALLEQLGRNCAANLGWAKQYKDNPDAYFAFMKQRLGEEIEYDRDKGLITVTTPERDCVCQIANSKITPPIYCACSIGWQKNTYETILGKKVEVDIKEAVLRGSKRCVFQVRILA